MDQAKLSDIRVLYRELGTMSLWGIPYNMRPGQQPGDLRRAYRDYVPPPPGWYGSKQIDLSDWVWLGSPGWYGSMSPERQAEVKAFLEGLPTDTIPKQPEEWSNL